jgi:hypothetical protein
MIRREDVERLEFTKAIQQQRSLRRKETFLSYALVRRLVDEIRRLQKANQYLCKKLKEKNDG